MKVAMVDGEVQLTPSASDSKAHKNNPVTRFCELITGGATKDEVIKFTEKHKIKFKITKVLETLKN